MSTDKEEASRNVGLVSESEDGYLFDVQTGEVVGIIDPATREPIFFTEESEGVTEAKPFSIQSIEAADWVMSLKMREEAKMLAIAAQRVALMANLDGLTVEPRNRLKGLAYRFDRELEVFARKELDGSKSKTMKLPHGSIAFRKTPGSAEILDPAQAIAYVEEWTPENVKKSVSIDAIKRAIVADTEANEEKPDVSAFFREAQARENVSITTNLMK
jgi:hypothetical protein